MKFYKQNRFSSRKKFQKESVLTQNVQTQVLNEDSTTTRTEIRNGSIIQDMIIGSFLFIVGFPFLWFNERGYAYTKTFLRKYLNLCKEVDSKKIDPSNDFSLVCVQGESSTSDELSDANFEIKVSNCISLKRKCEMYQWVQHRESRRINNIEDEVCYTYTLEWKEDFIESSKFVQKQGISINFQHEEGIIKIKKFKLQKEIINNLYHIKNY